MIHFWAKTTLGGYPGISVYEHMVNVGSIARGIAENTPFLLERFALRSSEVGALAALHDLGKISPGFQSKCEQWLIANNLTTIARNGCWDTGTESDHGKVSHGAIQDFLLQQGIARSIAKYVASVLGGHHGKLKYLPSDRGRKPERQIAESQSGIDWNGERLVTAQNIWNYFKGDNCIDGLTGESSAIWWLAGLTSVADWIGSDERYFSPESQNADVNVASIANSALDSIGLTPPTLKKGLSFEQIFRFQPNEMQTQTLATLTGPGVFVIEAPMGMGKTEAALGAAYQLLTAGKASGIYFALPTQATSNRIHLRMNSFLEQIAPTSGPSRLIHGNSWLLREDLEYRPSSSGPTRPSEEDAQKGRDWFASAKRALLAPFGVGTVDQALLGVVASKHFFVRHFALAGKVVIIDEVHSYDIYTGTLVNKLIETLEGLGCTVIILSATLTKKYRDQITPCPANTTSGYQPYPLILGRRDGVVFTPVPSAPPVARKVTVDFVTSKQATEDAIIVARNGGAVLWVSNTIGAAQHQFKRFRDWKDIDVPVGLLHSRFSFWRREALEAEWMERFGKDSTNRCGSILVSTQIVEQSVDLDADLMITELAPTDMLLQRLGRLWRHERGKRPVETPRICIIEEERSLKELREMEEKAIVKILGSKAFVYAPFVLLRSLEVWKKIQKEGVSIPTQVRQMIESTYEDRDDEPKSWQNLYNEFYALTLAYRQKALSASNIWQPALEDQEGVQTRLNEMETVSMVLCRNINNREALFIDDTKAEIGSDVFQYTTAQALHRNLVKIPLHHFKQVKPCPELDQYIYENHCVGIVEDDESVTAAGIKEGVRLSYSDQMGLFIEKRSEKEDV